MALGFPSGGPQPESFIEPGKFIQLGALPARIELLHRISGVAFEEVWSDHEAAELDGLSVNLAGRRTLIKNKKAAGRARDRLICVCLKPVRSPDYYLKSGRGPVQRPSGPKTTSTVRAFSGWGSAGRGRAREPTHAPAPRSTSF